MDILLTIFAAGISEGTATLLKDFTVAMVIAAAGLALARLAWQPPVLGYLVAGMIIGPFTLPTPLISNLDTIGLLAELGLILLLFGIGLELGWRRIQQIGFRVLIIGVTEISLLTLLGVWIASILPGIDPSHGLYLGGAMAISSSAILLKGLRDGGNLNSSWGQTIVGILLVEDFAAVILLTVLAGLATTGTANLADAGILAGKLAIFCVVVLVAGTMLAARIMRWLSQLQSDETLLLASLGFCFLLALCATLLGLSPAAGSFMVGVVIGDTAAAERVNRMVSPVRDMFGALFFLSIGMLIDYRTLGDFIVPALVVMAVFMAGKMIANTVCSILAGRSSGDAMRVGMTMPQMGEFSLAIGRLTPTDVMGGSTLGPVLSIVTAITSVLAPLTGKAAVPLSGWLGQRSPAPMRRVMLGISLAVNIFWSILSIPGPSGREIRSVARRILINASIVAVLSAAGAGIMFSSPGIVGRFLHVSTGVSALITVGVVVGLSTPAVIGIWRSLRTLAHLVTGYPNLPTAQIRGMPNWAAVQAIVEYGLATALLALLFLLLLPLFIRLFALGGLSVSVSLVLLVASALAVGIISFRVHRVLEPAFRDTFLPTASVPVSHHDDDVETPALPPEPDAQGDATRRMVSPLISAYLESEANRGAPPGDGEGDTGRADQVVGQQGEPEQIG
ncbi:MAG: cation:proton antiporter [Chloroflexota bacterium]|nr:cation:proton antiporter [Chloroflexota bacterium]MDE2685816.1 cation:proton antiporter [Chloroflexota bacterium]